MCFGIFSSCTCKCLRESYDAPSKGRGDCAHFIFSIIPSLIYGGTFLVIYFFLEI